MKSLSLDTYTLKLIAIISMALHHVVMVLWEIFPLWVHIPAYMLRGITFPIMGFFVVEGFRRTSNIQRYIKRLFIFGLISQIPHTLALGLFMPNIVLTILLGLLCLMMYDKLYVKMQKKALFVILFIVIAVLSILLQFEGGLVGPILILMYHVIKNERKRRFWPLMCWGIMNMVFGLLNRLAIGLLPADVVTGMLNIELLLANYLWVLPLGTFLIIPLLMAYNGERGRRTKFLFYYFYPIHWAVLAAIAFALGLTDFANIF